MTSNKFVGIVIKWDYATHRCHISMPGYIENLLIKFKHPCLTKPHPSPHKCLPIAYGAKARLTPMADTSQGLNLHQNTAFNRFLDSSSTMLEQSTTSSW
jgi:hypothetical protein